MPAYAVFTGLIKKGTTFVERYSDDELLLTRDFCAGHER
jgi:hypothetical protein